jgi:L-ascorbate metabolism protein UlaG (beta-lactamase superfamily)
VNFLIIKWLGHASFLIETEGLNVYIDPYAGKYDKKADLILITHGHHDHCDLSKISAVIRPETVIVTSKECSKQLSGKIFTLDAGETKEVKGLKITGVESYNMKRFRSPGVPYHPKGIQTGFILKAEGKTVYHSGDTDFLPSMKNLGEVDVALIPIGGTYTMDLNEAIDAVLAINPKIAVPIHRLDADAGVFKKKVENQSNIKVKVMIEREELTL